MHCVACGCAADTFVIVTGSPSWQVAALTNLGVSQVKAIARLVERADPG